MTNDEILNKYYEEIMELSKIEKDTEKEFGYANSWWVFEEVAKELDYDIFMAEVDKIGYKRTKRGEKVQPNELYRFDEDGNILVDDGIEETVLDYIRKIVWE